MEFVLIRIDDRLIHGQVALGWSRAKGINCILAVDDNTSKNSFQCSLLKMATPPGVKSYIVSVEEAVKMIKNDELHNKKVMLLVKCPKTIIELVNSGIDIKNVNVGNMRSKNANIKILEYVYATEEELQDWKSLNRMSVELYGQSFPDQQKSDLNKLIENL